MLYYLLQILYKQASNLQILLFFLKHHRLLIFKTNCHQKINNNLSSSQYSYSLHLHSHLIIFLNLLSMISIFYSFFFVELNSSSSYMIFSSKDHYFQYLSLLILLNLDLQLLRVSSKTL